MFWDFVPRCGMFVREVFGGVFGWLCFVSAAFGWDIVVFLQ